MCWIRFTTCFPDCAVGLLAIRLSVTLNDCEYILKKLTRHSDPNTSINSIIPSGILYINRDIRIQKHLPTIIFPTKDIPILLTASSTRTSRTNITYTTVFRFSPATRPISRKRTSLFTAPVKYLSEVNPLRYQRCQTPFQTPLPFRTRRRSRVRQQA